MRKILSGLLFLLISIVGLAQNDLSKPTLSFVAIDVSNIDVSINWYKMVFDMKVEDRVDNAERGFKQSNLTNAYFHIELVELVNSTTRQTAENLTKKSIQGLVKYGFKVTDFDHWHEKLEKLNAKFLGRVIADAKGKRTMIVEDPDGNLIQFFEI